jgi:hypothetical protein
MATFAAKIASLQHTVATLMRLNERLECSPAEPAAPGGPQDIVPSFGVLQASATVRTGGPAALARLPQEPVKDAVDAKALIKTLLLGLKTLVWSITHFNNPGSGTGSLPAPGYGVEALSADQVQTVARLFRTTPPCLRIFAEGAESSDAHEAFAAVFAVMEPRNLLDAIQLRLDDLFTAKGVGSTDTLFIGVEPIMSGAGPAPAMTGPAPMPAGDGAGPSCACGTGGAPATVPWPTMLSGQ